MQVIQAMLIKASEINTSTQANTAMAVVPRPLMRLSPRSHPRSYSLLSSLLPCPPLSPPPRSTVLLVLSLLLLVAPASPSSEKKIPCTCIYFYHLEPPMDRRPPHEAPKLIARGKLTFGEKYDPVIRVVGHGSVYLLQISASINSRSRSRAS